jgi:membrane-associated protein
VDFFSQLVDLFLHLDTHLQQLVTDYGVWTYGILFVVIFCETGLVVTPFLPGDSLLFAVGALAATGALNIWLLIGLLLIATIMGDLTNYTIGYRIGLRLFAKLTFRGRRLVKQEHLDRTHAFYEKYGGKTIIIARFVPIVRTFTPFVASVGKMTFPKYISYCVVGALLWVGGVTTIGYLFGNIEFVKKNFSVVVLAIIFISVLPAVIEWWRHRRASAAAAGGVERE